MKFALDICSIFFLDSFLDRVAEEAALVSTLEMVEYALVKLLRMFFLHSGVFGRSVDELLFVKEILKVEDLVASAKLLAHEMQVVYHYCKSRNHELNPAGQYSERTSR